MIELIAKNHIELIEAIKPITEYRGPLPGLFRRIYEFPVYAKSVGVLPTLAYYFSRSSYETYVGAYRYLHKAKKKANINGIEIEYVKSELEPDDKKGYSLYLALVADVLERSSGRILDTESSLAEFLYNEGEKYEGIILKYSIALEEALRTVLETQS